MDKINHPPHYTSSDVEPIDVIESWGLGFHLGNVIKYIARAEHKGSPVEDLEKAAWYLARAIEKRLALSVKRSKAREDAIGVVDKVYINERGEDVAVIKVPLADNRVDAINSWLAERGQK